MRSRRLKIAIIADDFTIQSFLPDADLYPLTPSNWRWKLKFKKVDLLFVESAWRGYKSSWKGKIASYPDKENSFCNLYQLVEYCNKKSIPTVFWNKEDPVNYKRFEQASLPFRYIYTTDVGSVAKYSERKKAEAVFIGALPFSAQPKLFRPPSESRMKKGTAFLGGFYGNEFPERSRVTTELLSGLRNYNLLIYDRFYFQGRSSFPDIFLEYVRPPENEKNVTALYRKYPLYLNINTVTDSPTMLSRRVFELASSGACFISNPSEAMRNFFHGLIPEVSTSDEAREVTAELMSDTARREMIGSQLHNLILTNHTTLHRLHQIQQDLGL